ncbi:MAG: ATP-binding cassette domain-containing protein [Lawsonibacter sp.]|jgi:ABC-type Fe3+/spermidine/putrescine transport system ATPase subunit
MFNLNSNLLSIQNLSVQRGNFRLQSISLTIKVGEIVALIGKTGAGKTLLLEAAAGFYPPDSGQVLYQGTSISTIPIFQRKIGYLYQDYGLFPHMTAEQNIAFPLTIQRVAKTEIRHQVAQMADRFGIQSILSQYPGTLSGGEQQRVALARALMMRPPLLLLDEPFSALDPVTKQNLYQMLHEIRDTFGCAILFVTHDFYEAEQLADRIGVLISGQLRGIVDSGQLFTAPWERDVRQFLGLTAPVKEGFL